MSFFERFFKLSAHGTSVRTEVIAGLTIFATMAYVLAGNPLILHSTGMPLAPLITVTVGGVFSDDMTPIFYAEKAGYFRREGLDVNLVPATIGNPIELPRFQAFWIGWHNRRVAQFPRQS